MCICFSFLSLCVHVKRKKKDPYTVGTAYLVVPFEMYTGSTHMSAPPYCIVQYKSTFYAWLMRREQKYVRH